jgi:hypothetical protein
MATLDEPLRTIAVTMDATPTIFFMCGSSLYVDLAAASRRRPVLYGGVRMPLWRGHGASRAADDVVDAVGCADGVRWLP